MNALAFLGCGQATRMHSKTLARVAPDVRLYYASRDPARALEFRGRFDGAGVFDSYEAALADARIDAVLVATPPASHLDLTLRALRAGKHVIVEKPPFLRAADFDAVADAERTGGRRVLIAENYFYKPLLRTLREILGSGALGEVRLLHINAVKQQRVADWRGEPALAGGGALFEGGIHWIDFVANLGIELRAVRGFRPAGVDPEQTMLVVLEYANGAVGTLSYSWEIPSPLKGIRISRIFGTEGALAFESNGIFVAQSGRRTRIVLPGMSDIAGYRAMFRDFIDAIRSSREPAFNTARARRDLELVEQAYQTANTAP